MLAVTFTNKAARELRERLTKLVGPSYAEQITMGTFHSLCLAMLRVDIDKLPPELGYAYAAAAAAAAAVAASNTGTITTIAVTTATTSPLATLHDHTAANHHQATATVATAAAISPPPRRCAPQAISVAGVGSRCTTSTRRSN